jgi:hypothetical protein
MKYFEVLFEACLYNKIHNAFESLGYSCKKLLECFYYQNLRWDEIAQSLGYSSEAIAVPKNINALRR